MFPGPDLAEVVDAPELWRAMIAAAEEGGIAVVLARLDVAPPRMLYASPRAVQIFGREGEALTEIVPWSMLLPEDVARARALVERPVNAPPIAISLVIARPDGRQIPIEIAMTRLSTRAGLLTFGYFRDVSAEHQTRAALEKSEARFRFLVEGAPDGVVILQRGIIVFMNPKAARLLGVASTDQALGRSLAEFVPPADAAAAGARIAEMLRTDQEMPPNEYGVIADPDRVVEIKSTVCEWEGGPAVLALARDVTDRKAIQARLVEADRLAALGALAAGVAHEINNPLTFIQLSAQRIERALAGLAISDPTRAVSEHLRDIDHGIARVASITQGLRTFARADDAPPGPVDLRAVVERALRMVDNDLRHRARLVRNLAAVPPVTGNASQLEQVVVNLMLNAIQALPDDQNLHAVEVELAEAGDHVRLVIRDTGRGIPPAVRDRIFDPFFTTRAIGEGMGLGLAVSKTIIEGFGGTIAVDSVEGTGTRAVIDLRVHTARSALPAAEPARVPPTSRRILIVDDERLVRDVLARLLANDHEVTTAATGEEALQALAASSFDAIFCDVMMPGMNGREVHRRATAIAPAVGDRFVFMSGGTFNTELDQFLATVPNRKLPKPFKLDDVLDAIVELDRHGGRSG